MKKNNLNILLVAVLLVASIGAQIYINTQNNITTEASSEQHIENDSTEAELFQMDVEIIKTIIERGKEHLPIISGQTGL